MKINELFENRRSSYREMRLRNSWALLPAARVLFNKNKVTVDEVTQFDSWHDGSILVTKNKGRTVFLHSSGEWSKSDIGKVKSGHHDQSFADLGEFEVENVIHWTRNKDGEVKIKSVNDKGLKEKAPLYVFK